MKGDADYVFYLYDGEDCTEDGAFWSFTIDKCDYDKCIAVGTVKGAKRWVRLKNSTAAGAEWPTPKPCAFMFTRDDKCDTSSLHYDVDNTILACYYGDPDFPACSAVTINGELYAAKLERNSNLETKE